MSLIDIEYENITLEINKLIKENLNNGFVLFDNKLTNKIKHCNFFDSQFVKDLLAKEYIINKYMIVFGKNLCKFLLNVKDFFYNKLDLIKECKYVEYCYVKDFKKSIQNNLSYKFDIFSLIYWFIYSELKIIVTYKNEGIIYVDYTLSKKNDLLY